MGPVPCQNIDANSFHPPEAVSVASNAAPRITKLALSSQISRRLTPTAASPLLPVRQRESDARADKEASG